MWLKIDSLHQQLLCWLHARFIPVYHSKIFICLRQLDCEGQNLVSLTAPSRGAHIVDHKPEHISFHNQCLDDISCEIVCRSITKSFTFKGLWTKISQWFAISVWKFLPKIYQKIVFLAAWGVFVYHLIILNSTLTRCKIQFCISLPSFLNARVKRSFRGNILLLQYIWQQT